MNNISTACINLNGNVNITTIKINKPYMFIKIVLLKWYLKIFVLSNPLSDLSPRIMLR